jgi:hypothetical protein
MRVPEFNTTARAAFLVHDVLLNEKRRSVSTTLDRDDTPDNYFPDLLNVFVNTAHANDFLQRASGLDRLDSSALTNIKDQRDAVLSLSKTVKSQLREESAKAPADQNSEFIESLTEYQAILNKLEKNFDEYHKQSLLLSDLLSQVTGLPGNESGLINLQSSVQKTLQDRDNAESTLLTTLKEIRSHHQTNESKTEKITAAKALFDANPTFETIETDNLELMKKYAQDLGLGNLSSTTDITRAAEKLTKLTDANDKFDTAFTSFNLPSLTEGEITNLEGRKSETANIQSEWKSNTALRDEITNALLLAQESHNQASELHQENIERAKNEGNTVEKQEAIKKATANLSILNPVFGQVESLIQELAGIERELGPTPDWSSVSSTLQSRINKALTKYNELRTGIASNVKLNELISSLELPDLSVPTGTPPDETVWAAINPQRSTLDTTLTALNTQIVTEGSTRVANGDTTFFETKWTHRESYQVKANEAAQTEEIINRLGLANIQTQITSLEAAITTLSATQTPAEIEAVRTALSSFVEHVDGLENKKSVPGLVDLRNRAQEILDKPDTDSINVSTITALHKQIETFHRDATDSLAEATHNRTYYDEKVTEVTGILAAHTDLIASREAVRDAKLRETSLKAFETALGALSEAQTPEQFKALEDKVNELEAKLQSTGDTSLQSQVDALKEQIKAGADGKDGTGLKGEKGDKGDGSGMPWYRWALGIASFAVGGFGLFSASQAKQSADDQKKKFEATMAQLDQRLGDLQQMTSVSLKNSAVAAQRAGVASKNAQIAQRTAIKTENRVNQIRPFARKSSKKKVGVGS